MEICISSLVAGKAQAKTMLSRESDVLVVYGGLEVREGREASAVAMASSNLAVDQGLKRVVYAQAGESAG